MEEYENVLTLRDETIVQALSTLRKASRKAEQLMNGYRPIVNGERLLTDAEVSQILNVSRRTLQEYRNSRQIAFIELRGKTLYRESDIEQMLERNYRKAIPQ